MGNEKSCIEWQDYSDKFAYWKQVVEVFQVLESLERKQEENQKSIDIVREKTQRIAIEFLKENPIFNEKGEEIERNTFLPTIEEEIDQIAEELKTK